MNKQNLINAYSEKYSVTKKNATEIIENIIDLVTDTLVSGNNIAIANFGTLEVRKRAGRKGINPQNGEEIFIRDSKTVAFKTGKGLKSLIN